MLIQPINQIARMQGAKIIIYGGPGTGKTPLCAGINDSLMVITEPGTLSVRSFNTPSVQCYSVQTINEFFTWLRSDTKEKNAYQTISIDSISEMCSIRIRELEGRGSKGGNQADGRKVYGDMARAIITDINYLYYISKFNVVLVAKRGEVDFEGVTKFRPYFPGKQLNTEIPHLFDGIYHVDKVPGKWDLSTGVPTIGIGAPGTTVPAILTQESNSYTARDRSGALAAIEYPDMNYVLSKINNS